MASFWIRPEYVRVRVRVEDISAKTRASSVRVRVEDISAKTQASSVNPLKNSYYLVGILCLHSPTGLGLGLGWGHGCLNVENNPR